MLEDDDEVPADDKTNEEDVNDDLDDDPVTGSDL